VKKDSQAQPVMVAQLVWRVYVETGEKGTKDGERLGTGRNLGERILSIL